MADLYGCSKTTILTHAKKIGYKNTYTGQLSQTDKEAIVNAYNEKTSEELAKEYGVSRGMITKVWYDNKLAGKDRHKYPFDYDYFSNINSKDKAYFLGLIAADGCVSKKDKIYSTKITLQYGDKCILETFSRCVNSFKPLIVRANEKNKYATLDLVSQRMFDDLSQYGIVPRKTLGFDMPFLGKEYMSHFFRGYFDGDGSISIDRKEYHLPSSYNIIISGYEHNLRRMQDYLLEKENIHSIITLDKRNYELPFGSLVFINIKEKYNFLKYIYKDCEDLYIPRKKYKSDCFLSVVEKKKNTPKQINLIEMPS